MNEGVEDVLADLGIGFHRRKLPVYHAIGGLGVLIRQTSFDDVVQLQHGAHLRAMVIPFLQIIQSVKIVRYGVVEILGGRHSLADI